MAKINIPVEADFDSTALKREIDIVTKKMEGYKAVAESAGKVKIDIPIITNHEDLYQFKKLLKEIEQSYDAIGSKVKKLKTEGATALDLNLNKTLQKGAAANLATVILTELGAQVDRVQKVRAPRARTPRPGDNDFIGPMPAPKVPRPGDKNFIGPMPRPYTPPPAPQQHWQKAGMNFLMQSMGAFGPVGNVAGNALGSGLSMGAGAGLAGLAGGLGALLVGKVVGAVMDKVSDSQQQAIMMDKVLRATGLSAGHFGAARAAFYGGANSLGMKINDYTQFSGSYARAANFQGNGYELMKTTEGVGQFARAYGLEPGEMQGPFAQASSLNIARGSQQTRQLGIMIGEGIAKSGAFASADKMASALGSYLQFQSRVALTAPNSAGYMGMLSGMVGSGIPGMDVEGAAGLLNRVNTNLMQGGAFGTASKNFNARMMLRNGMNPFQAMVMNEGGAFATKDQMFGPGSMYYRTHGAGGPSGNKTLLEMTKEGIAREYPRGSEQYYVALAKDLGIGVNEAMALDSLKSNDVTSTLSTMKGYGIDTKSVNLSNVNDLIKAGSGRAGAMEVGAGLLARTGEGALNDEEKARLTAARKSGNDDELKKVTMQLAATHTQAETEGSKTRDSINKTSNILQNFSDKALPALNMMRMALVNASGKSEAQIRGEYYQTEQKQRIAELGASGKSQHDDILARREALLKANNYKIGLNTPGPEGDKLRALKREEQQWDADQAKQRNAIYSDINNKQFGAANLSPEQQEKISKLTINDKQFAQLDSWNEYFKEASDKYGVPVNELKAQVMTESGGRIGAVSSAGARGLGGIMPGNEYGYNINTVRGSIMATAANNANWRRVYGSGPDHLRGYNGGYRDTKRWGSKENMGYVPTVEHYQSQIEAHDAGYVPPEAMAAAGGNGGGAGKQDVNVNLNSQPVVVQVVDAEGYLKQQVTGGGFTMDRGFGNARR
ncbi:hypothetical protein ID007_004298 [Salmonella enterica]|nr:hypothetical protein [Salmonella enterica]